MKRKFSNRNEPIAELVAARLRGKRMSRPSSLNPRVDGSSSVWTASPTVRKSIAGPKLIKKWTVEKSTDLNIRTDERNPAVSKSRAM